MARKARNSTRTLRDACVTEALAIIGKEGLEKLSLREVARRLGVSHQAPYKHFESRDHLLSEVVRRAYDDFAAYLDGRRRARDAEGDLRSMGEAYLTYAATKPLQYRLMFETPLPSPESYPEMMVSARHAFTLLRNAVAARSRRGSTRMAHERDAMFIWATMHGLASILRSEVMHTLDLDSRTARTLAPEVMDRIRHGLAG